MTRNLSLIRGDTLAFTITINGLTEDLTAAYFTVKTDYNATEPSIQKTLEDGITSLSVLGSYAVRVAPEDTASLNTGTYVYDLQITIGDDVYTPLIGSFIIGPDVTN